MEFKEPAPRTITEVLLWLVRGDRKKSGKVTALPVGQINAAVDKIDVSDLEDVDL